MAGTVDMENMEPAGELLVQNEPQILGEIINGCNMLGQNSNQDIESHYSRRSSRVDPNLNCDDIKRSNISDFGRSLDNNTGADDIKLPEEMSLNDENTTEPLTKIKTNPFSRRLRDQRKKIGIKFLVTILTFAVFIFTIFTLYQGSNVDTEKYYHRLNFLAVLQDDTITSEMMAHHIVPLADILNATIQTTPGKWSVYDSKTFSEKYGILMEPEVINKKIVERVYHEYFWISLNVKPNATMQLLNSIVNSTASPFNTTNIFEVTFESGRDPTNIPSTILPLVQGLEAKFKAYYYNIYLPAILTNITENGNYTITSNFDNLAAMANIGFYYNDYRPFYRRGLITPTQVGVIDGLLLTVFQFLIYSPLHTEMSKLLCPRNYILYRISISFITFFFISLFYCSIPGFFGFDYGRAFGRGGFMVYWMSTLLYMVACGSTNENVISLIFLWKPEFMGFWITIFVMLNVAPSFFPMALDNVFYRYGYVMPIHNAIDIFRVIFMDTSRKHMGRNYGVLVAWIVINSALCPIILKYVDKVNRRRQIQAVKKSSRID
ncbi:similar to Saccharomyces cerevisiae YGR197C SNG1 Protein involved in resistance to nitrosoguanidine (MNNG) and 6-azauracil (6- AU) [Maudiozyma barnettii]|uniref:Similar to Saccharomyces cerevisiae YGR197C SNG1 Protein involved in resistance to nitrosoguanidine (MNNG) and 6-azauracil (6- AU) n=1 Tax=Maudiozyma barnettii TaxID=61262 RepID=A0A8H2ZJ05_9SACH|nr:uncharacterized protein KABA2_09S04906 [Kazachstania barnettii]CAB4256448.1 similar to Saccharomyces cerevisiae YGR197C SNG1 Protein involved in resistance to nitrosoguanidine (MNNG) and 6-azauracil (6- AU) [Kazachstania barnettii]CAD1785057.1 similar to Saccharomyces cerevisiae YGR197C SNG1 Protein involved in resistance to nitrosoguanidine (MNNG) and 6-azauracil (6- AU) [Kazachstania barnettii]